MRSPPDEDNSDLELPLAGAWRLSCCPLLSTAVCPLEGVMLLVLSFHTAASKGCLPCRLPLLQCA